MITQTNGKPMTRLAPPILKPTPPALPKPVLSKEIDVHVLRGRD